MEKKSAVKLVLLVIALSLVIGSTCTAQLSSYTGHQFGNSFQGQYSSNHHHNHHHDDHNRCCCDDDDDDCNCD
jgi:hypothetical protein